MCENVLHATDGNVHGERDVSFCLLGSSLSSNQPTCKATIHIGVFFFLVPSASMAFQLQKGVVHQGSSRPIFSAMFEIW